MNKSAAVSIFEYRIMNESKACIIADRFETTVFIRLTTLGAY